MISQPSDFDLLPMTLLFIGAGMAAHTVGTLLFGLYASPRQLTGNNDLIQTKMPMFQKIALLGMVFAVSVSWLHYGNVNGRIQHEATRLMLLVRTALVMPEPGRGHLLEAIAAYGETVADADWRAMREGKRSQAAATAFTALSGAVSAIEVATPRESVHLRFSNRLVRDLAAAREARIESSFFPLGEVMQVLLYAILGATLIFIWFAGLTSVWIKLVMGWLFVSLAMVAMMYLDVLAHPLSGYTGMDGEPFAEVARSAAALAKGEATP